MRPAIPEAQGGRYGGSLLRDIPAAVLRTYLADAWTAGALRVEIRRELAVRQSRPDRRP